MIVVVAFGLRTRAAAPIGAARRVQRVIAHPVRPCPALASRAGVTRSSGPLPRSRATSTSMV
jgi:hypothetical protein